MPTQTTITPDTIIQNSDTVSFLYSNNLDTTLHNIPIDTVNNNWLFIISFAAIFLIVLGKNFAPTRFKTIIRSVVSFYQLENLAKEKNVFSHGTSISLILSTILAGSILAYQINFIVNGVSYQNSILPYFDILKFALAISLFWILKSIIIRLIGFLFLAKYSSRLQLLNIFTINIIGSMVIIAIIPLSIYTEKIFLTWISLAFVLVLYIYRLIRGFINGVKENRFSFVYIILYLCTLEIVPAIIIVKFVINNSSAI